MNAPTPELTAGRARGRRVLLLIFAMFFGSMALAGALRFSGWMPQVKRNHGQLLQPPPDLRQEQPRLADGRPYAWDPSARLWRIVLAPPADCAPACVTLSQQLDKVWRLFGHNADNVQILWLGSPPEQVAALPALQVLQASPALRAKLPGVDDPAGIPVYVIDPNGFVVLRYAPGFDPGGLRTDLSRLLKLK
ncbi:hypothetical protein [Stenotrophomonas mori]|uniref:Thioredoxin domain-containing protein n=1 Tax=Stenotrophomonas mori TaxID=2871096 RepID=A0ABT0SK84_9GAMM|nr:hypothetical protein [Stenotrophomonas mori]MCL7715521.1 hypothetical protein [Stenotrophomonas mori]